MNLLLWLTNFWETRLLPRRRALELFIGTEKEIYTASFLLSLGDGEKNVTQMFIWVTLLLSFWDKVRSNPATLFYGKSNALRISASHF